MVHCNSVKSVSRQEIVKEVLLPLYNAYRFFVQEATRWERSAGRSLLAGLAAGAIQSEHFLDRPAPEDVHACTKKLFYSREGC